MSILSKRSNSFSNSALTDRGILLTGNLTACIPYHQLLVLAFLPVIQLLLEIRLGICSQYLALSIHLSFALLLVVPSSAERLPSECSLCVHVVIAFVAQLFSQYCNWCLFDHHKLCETAFAILWVSNLHLALPMDVMVVPSYKNRICRVSFRFSAVLRSAFRRTLQWLLCSIESVFLVQPLSFLYIFDLDVVHQ